MLPPPALTGRIALLADTDAHPYVRLTADDDVTAYRLDGTLLWTAAQGPWGPVAAALGDGPDALELIAALAARNLLAGMQWLHLPRLPGAQVAARLPIAQQDDWDYLWTEAEPEPCADEHRVVQLGPADRPAIESVLDDSLPHSTSRPDDGRIRRWFGLLEPAAGGGTRLVAVAGDRSVNGVGFLAGIAVAADRQGRGYGTAVTTAATRRLVAEFGVSSLGVMADNLAAIRLYQRLGYTGRITRSSVMLAR